MEESQRRLDLYREFIKFVHHDFLGERRVVSRRIFSVFVWCFFLPAIVSLVLILLMKFGIVPRSIRRYLEWVVLIFPLLFSLYVLGFEVLKDIPIVLRRGGIGNTLGQAVKDTEWRDQICRALAVQLGAHPPDWAWIASNYRIDLRAIQYRAKHLTALAGAVFFLLMQGIDSLGGGESVAPAQTFQGWFENSSDNLSQFVGLALFLVLFYLSGSQTYHSLVRYLDCVELLSGGALPSKASEE